MVSNSGGIALASSATGHVYLVHEPTLKNAVSVSQFVDYHSIHPPLANSNFSIRICIMYTRTRISRYKYICYACTHARYARLLRVFVYRPLHFLSFTLTLSHFHTLWPAAIHFIFNIRFSIEAKMLQIGLKTLIAFTSLPFSHSPSFNDDFLDECCACVWVWCCFTISPPSPISVNKRLNAFPHFRLPFLSLATLQFVLFHSNSHPSSHVFFGIPLTFVVDIKFRLIWHPTYRRDSGRSSGSNQQPATSQLARMDNSVFIHNTEQQYTGMLH